MKTDEDEAFDYIEQQRQRNEIPTKPILDPYREMVRVETIEEIAKAIEKFEGAFGADTVASFAAFVRSMKR
jgi:hypothetical protein